MGLGPVKQTAAGVIPVFAKVFELFTGGFSVVSTNLRDDVTLPAGSLFTVDEETRQATPIKTAKLAATAANDATQIKVDSARYFKVGDNVALVADGSAFYINQITATGGAYDIIHLGTALGIAATVGSDNNVLFLSGVHGTTGARLEGTANAISAYDVKVNGNLQNFISVLRRGTAYKKRIQPHLAGHISDLPDTIEISKSY